MNRDKQTEIHELAKQMSEAISTEVEQKYIMEEVKLEAVLRANGWVKAEEIFAEIEERLRQLADESKILRDKEINLGEKTQLNGEWIGVRLALRDIAELKKKYESEKENG